MIFEQKEEKATNFVLSIVTFIVSAAKKKRDLFLLKALKYHLGNERSKDVSHVLNLVSVICETGHF